MKNLDTKNLKIAKRYALALIEATKDKVDLVCNNLATIENAISENEDFKNFLLHPIISLKDKKDVVEEIFNSKVDKEVLNFLLILLEENRFNIFQTIFEVYKKEADVIKNIQRIEIVSAVEIEEKLKNKLEETINKKLNKKVILNYEEQKEIIGGLIVKFEDTVVDLSLKTKFDKLRKN